MPPGYKIPKGYNGYVPSVGLAYGNLGTGSTSGTGGTKAAAPANPTTTPAKTMTFSVPGTDPQSQIFDDPAFQTLKNLLSAQGISDASHLRGSIQQALISFGAVPQLPQDVLDNSGLDSAGTAELAKNNPFSVLSRLAQSYDDQQLADKNQLAARGILSSGETGYQLGKLGQAQAGAQYDATNSLLGSIGQFNDAYAQGRQQAAQQLAQGALTAESTVAANGGGAPTSVTATWDPATGTYVDPSGNRYDQSGNRVSLPGPTQTPAPSNTPGTSGVAANPLPTDASPNVGYQQSPRNTGTFAGL